MSISIDSKELYVRELTESEAQLINSAKLATPMIMSPDIGKIKDTQEDVKIQHAFLSQDGLNYGLETSDGKYTTKPAAEVELINPKFNWDYIAKQNEKRQ